MAVTRMAGWDYSSHGVDPADVPIVAKELTHGFMMIAMDRFAAQNASV
jgi:hypothetical protein